MARKRQDDKPLTPEQLEAAGRAAFTGAHQDWPKIQSERAERYAAGSKAFTDMVNEFRLRTAIDPRRDSDIARMRSKARPFSDLFFTPEESVRLLADRCKNMVDEGIAHRQLQALAAADLGEARRSEFNPRDATIKGAEVLAVDTGRYKEHQTGAYLRTLLAVPVPLRHLPEDKQAVVKAKSDQMAVPLSQDENILFPAMVVVRNPRNQYQIPSVNSEGEPCAQTELGLANHRVTYADAKKFAALPDPRIPSLGPPQFNDYKFLVEHFGSVESAHERSDYGGAPTLASVIDDTERYDGKTRSNALNTAQGMVMAERSGLERGAILDLRCTSLEATLRRSLGEMTPKQRQDQAKGYEITLSKPTGSLPVGVDGSLSSRGACSAPVVGIIGGGTIMKLCRYRTTDHLVMPAAEREIMVNTRARLRQRRGSDGIAD